MYEAGDPGNGNAVTILSTTDMINVEYMLHSAVKTGTHEVGWGNG